MCTCKTGVVTIVHLLNGLYDVLYESGVAAFISGFYSESVLSFTAALKRCFEYYVRLYLVHQNLSLESVDRVWKEMSNQSERQYGAFCVAFASMESEEWRADQKQVKFRNSAIHKGRIATRDETKKYAVYVTECINRVIQSYVPKLGDAEKIIADVPSGKEHPEVQKLLKIHPDAHVWRTALTGQPLLNRGGDSWGRVTFDDALVELQRRILR